MANLADRLALRQVAWNFSSSTRVFKVPKLIVTAQEEKEEFETAAGTFGIDFKGIWLSFAISTQYFKEQVSGTACDRIDILNALKGTSTVLFYPDYEFQPLISYAVKSSNSSLKLFESERGLFKPAQTISMRAVSRVSDYPTFLKYR